MTADVLVVGGGPAGAAAATWLARGGRDVVLVEREPEAHHKVCGEFLSREALAYLRALGVDARVLGAEEIHSVRLARGSTVSEVRLPFPALSLTRLRLDEALLDGAQKAGARVLRGRSVKRLEPAGEGWAAELEDGDRVCARTALLATGKHDLRGWPRPAGKQNDLVGFKMYWRLSAAQTRELAGHVELLLYRGGYGGLQPVEDGAANLCWLVRRAELQRMGGRWTTLLEAMLAQSPHLAKRLQGAQPLLQQALAISAIPYGYVCEAADGLWRLGDQAAVIPSFTGDGMSIAMHTAKVAAQMHLAGATAQRFQSKVKRQLSRQVGVATILSQQMVARPGVMATVARMWPGALRVAARRTRIAPQAMNAGVDMDAL